MRLSAKLACLAVLHVIVSCVFLKGFLLTRLELPDVASCTDQGGPWCNSARQSTIASSEQTDVAGSLPPYSKAVLLIVDALRYDFVCEAPNATAPWKGRMPRTLALLGAAEPGAAVVARFIADTPTITMSRLKALLTGGLPTFLDVGQSFSASALTEDNLLSQLKAAGKRLAVMGDDTWMQLAAPLFSEAYPFPSFDVHDLHTVDDGVAKHLPRLLRAPGDWDVLVAHWLGVDHAGHTYGVASDQMAAKLEQLDGQVADAIDLMLQGAGPGGPYEHTLLLVLSDHGQTLGGDHGGGSPAETDSILLAAGLGRLRAAGQQQGQIQQQQQQQQQHVVALPNCQMGVAGATAAATAASPLLHRLIKAGGYTDPAVVPAPPPHSAADGMGCWPWLCSTRMSQIDLTPTLAMLLGVPIPFGNLGRIPPHLFAALFQQRSAYSSSSSGKCSAGDDSSALRPAMADDWLPSYAAALAANAAQVERYLRRYAAVGGLPAAQLSSTLALHDSALSLQASCSPTGDSGGTSGSGSGSGCEGVVSSIEALLRFLSQAAQLARSRFTLFQQGPIWVGCALAAALLLLQLWACVSAMQELAPQGAFGWPLVTLCCLSAFHALGLFSVGLIMGEGRLASVLLAGLAAVLWTATGKGAGLLRNAAPGAVSGSKVQSGTAAGAASRSCCGSGSGNDGCGSARAMAASAAAAAMLFCNGVMQWCGLIDRWGQDPHDKAQPSAELLVGPDAVWQRGLYSISTLAPLGASWLLLCHVARLVAACGTAPLPPSRTLCDNSKNRSSSGGGGGGGGGGSGDSIAPTHIWQEHVRKCGLVAVRSLCALQCMCIALFWCAQLSGRDELSLAEMWQRLQLYSSVVRSLTDSTAAVVAPLLRLPALAATLQLPARLLLPRVVYAAALAAICGMLPAASLMCGARQAVVGAEERPVSSAGAELCVWLAAAFAAPLTLVLGHKGPTLLLLAGVQAAAAVKLLRIVSQSATGGAPSLRAAAAGGGLGLAGLHLFFCSGHFCEFSGLHYASAFIGFDTMAISTSAPLLLLNSFGSIALAALMLPAALLLAGAGSCSSSSNDGHAPRSAVLRELAAGSLVANTTRAAGLAVCMVSAAVQQGHILLWAIFAPKLVFELWFMAVTDVAQLAAATLMEALL